MIVNLNTMCKVQLNETGKKIWLRQIEELPQEVIDTYPDVVETIKNKVDMNGFLEIELWSLMNLFGQFMSPVTCPFVSTTIELNKNPNFENHFQVEEKT